jgi:outer membrane biogenesis lipoprotein LolB
MRTSRLLAAALLLLAACSSGQSHKAAAADSLTERERDSILAQSKIPGARGVGAAMRASDSISARVRAADTITP